MEARDGRFMSEIASADEHIRLEFVQLCRIQ
jgi:hypothetical protein